MNCDKCQELLSEFIDGELESRVANQLETHLNFCRECSEIYEDFAGIIGCCDKFYDASTPPNSQALWCRINNVIENEVKPELIKEAEAVEHKRGFFGKLLYRSWSFTFSQVAVAILGIAVVTSLLTVVSIKNAQRADEATAFKSAVQPSFFEIALEKIGLAKSPQEIRAEKIREQHLLVEYWNKRVEERKARWNKDVRDAFDRNLHEINQAVSEHTEILRKDPNDELSGEMLDSALDEKVQLLREFSEF